VDVLIFLFLDRSRVYARNSMPMSAHTPIPYPQAVLMMLCIATSRTASRGTLHPCNSPWHAWHAVSELDHRISRVPRSVWLKCRLLKVDSHTECDRMPHHDTCCCSCSCCGESQIQVQIDPYCDLRPSLGSVASSAVFRR